MSKNEIVSKARLLDKKNDYKGVLSLLQEYVKDHRDDTEALALYQKNLVNREFSDRNIDIDQLYGDERKRFNGVAEEDVLPLAALCFSGDVAEIYLTEKRTAEEKKVLVGSWLQSWITALGNRLDDYAVFKKQMDEFYKALSLGGYEKYCYEYLCQILKWRSQVDKNILLYIVEKVKSAIKKVVSDEEIYEMYTKDMTTTVFPFGLKPPLRGDRLVVDNIKTQEMKDFWQGYFVLAKKIRQEEYDYYRQAVSDENHADHGVYLAGQYIHKSWLDLVLQKEITTDEVARLQVATQCENIKISESDYKTRLEDAEKACNTIRMNPIEQIKAWIMNLIGKK